MIYRRSSTTNQKWELLRKFPFLIGATVIQLDGRLSFGWLVWCPVDGVLAVFSKKVIFTTIQVIIFTHFIYSWISRTFVSDLIFNLHSSVFYQNHSLWWFGFWCLGSHTEATSCRLLNFWNIFWREIYNGVIENRSVASRHDYKGGII